MPEKKPKSTPKTPAKPKTKATPKTKTPAKGEETAAAAAPKKAAKKLVLKSKKAPASASGFSLDDALAIASKRTEEEERKNADIAAKERARKAIEEAEQKAEKRTLGAASLADILGYGSSATAEKKRDESEVPAKYRKFYELLVQLRNHVKQGLNMHAEETLKRSAKDDTGDLSSYSQHMADAGTETFDRDFALSMVSSEQEALQEIEAAIDRIFKGTYGLCEMTGKQIRDERLMAVPFTRYSMKTQEQLERNRIRSRNQGGGVFADASTDDSIGFGDDSDD